MWNEQLYGETNVLDALDHDCMVKIIAGQKPLLNEELPVNYQLYKEPDHSYELP